MLKSIRRSRFGMSNRQGSVTLIEAPVARSFMRRAVIAFFVVIPVVTLLSGIVISEYVHPILGFLLGLLLGILCGAAVALFLIVWPVLRVLWHWTAEILLSVGFVYGWTTLMQATPLWVSLLVVALVVGVPAVVGPVRRRIVAVSWCLIVRHRLRLCFAKLIRTDRDGTTPLILLAKPTPAGERVWVWLRPGLSIKDMEAEGQTHKLAVACWANEVRVMREGRRYAALIRIDITRREPLARTVTSPLPAIVPNDIPATAPVSPATPPRGLDLADVPETAAVLTPDGNRKPRNPQPFASTPEFDPSDYA